MVTKLINLTFALFWSIALGFALEYFGRRFFREHRRSAAMATIAAAAFLVGTLASPFRHPVPEVPVPNGKAPSVRTSASPRAMGTQSDISATCDPSSAAPAADGRGSFDTIIDAMTRVVVPDGGSIAKNERFAIYGWAANVDGDVLARGVCLAVDGKIVYAPIVTYGETRRDVAAALGMPTLASSGFKIEVAPNFLQAGTHRLAIVVINDDGSRSELKASRTLVLR